VSSSAVARAAVALSSAVAVADVVVALLSLVSVLSLVVATSLVVVAGVVVAATSVIEAASTSGMIGMVEKESPPSASVSVTLLIAVLIVSILREMRCQSFHLLLKAHKTATYGAALASEAA